MNMNMRTVGIIGAVAIVAIIGVLVLRGGTSSRPAADTTAAERGTSVLQKNADGYYDIDVETFAAMQENKDYTLVNVHIPYAGELPQTDAFIPFNDIAANLDKLPADKSAKLVVYCRSGSMSRAASQELARLGYTNLYDVNGGMNAWVASGRTLIGR